ncbi:unnamed protein product [Vicia faba]|uniref:Uncharacterized protein n=1 Tax=Vicia faba TaxID=3906 RepID=A0AAV0YQA9_VICFA|nr:unnamed protein product [Vicia faba]
MAKRFSGELSTAVFAEKSFTSSPLTATSVKLTPTKCLSNMSTGKHCLSKHAEVVVENGVVPLLVLLLSCKKYVIQMKGIMVAYSYNHGCQNRDPTRRIVRFYDRRAWRSCEDKNLDFHHIGSQF